jgi:ankyrin repeat protein
LACVQSLIKLSPSEVLSVCIQEPLLNHMLPIHIALLSGNLGIVIDICSIFNSLNISNVDTLSCHCAFAFQLLARAGSGHDLEIVSLQGSTKFACICLNQATSDSKIENSAIYSNYLQQSYNGGSLTSYLDSFERSNPSVFPKLNVRCIDCLSLCSMYGLTSHCRFLLSKAVPSNNRKALGYFTDNFGSWIPLQVSVIRDWSTMEETASWTPVNIAMHRGHREIMELLISHGNDCNTRSPLGWTPLTLACFNGEEDLVDLLLKNGVLASRPDAAGWTPVMVCVAKLGLRRIRYALEITGEWSIEGARDRLCNNVLKGLVEQPDGEPHSADLAMSMFDQSQDMVLSSKDNNISIMNKLLLKCNASTECSPNGWSALFTAICLQQLSVTKTLLASLADVNVGCVDGRQPLYAACCIPHVPLVVHLLKLGANPNPVVPLSRTKLTLQSIPSKEGTGPLLPQYQCVPIVAACKMGSLSALLALISACHASATFPDLEVVNAAASACIESISIHVLGMLLVHPATRKHASASISESFHGTCLLSLMLWAADACQLWALRAAVAYGGDINGTKNGTSSLHIACSRPEAFKIAIYLAEQVRMKRMWTPITNVLHLSKTPASLVLGSRLISSRRIFSNGVSSN